MDKRLANIAQRGLTLPEPTRLGIRKTGIFSRAALELVYQDQAKRWALRGEETGGAVAVLGHYVGFCKEGPRRPEVVNEIVFFHRAGTLSTELWGKDSAFRGGAAPRFFKRNGDEQLPPEAFIDALIKATEGVCCIGCKHTHLLELRAVPTREKAFATA